MEGTTGAARPPTDTGTTNEQLRALEAAATAGPWRAVSTSVENDRWTVSQYGNLDSLFVGGRVRAERDAALIAAMRNELPRLLADSERAEGLATSLSELLDVIEQNPTEDICRHQQDVLTCDGEAGEPCIDPGAP